MRTAAETRRKLTTPFRILDWLAAATLSANGHVFRS